MSEAKKGVVSLVGAGPGDPGLITVRGVETLQQSDVIVYDRLVNSRLLQYARAEATIIYVGKHADHHTFSQGEINELLINQAKAGKRVCRLKGGDPLVFGRGGEEAEALAEAGIPFVIVPGVTSGIAAATYAGIPLTHRELASTAAFITGHEDPSKESPSLRWEPLAAGVDTLVFYMGVTRLSMIVDQLIRHGRSPRTPVAVIRWGTTPRQVTVIGELENIVSRVAEKELKPPALIIVGDVVRMREKLRWFDTSPLFGKRVIVTRAKEQAGDFVSRLESFGAEVIEFPVIRIAELDSYERLDTALSYLKEYHWVIFTSANGVEAFFKRLYEQGGPVTGDPFGVPSPLGKAKVCAIGPATARQCAAYGLKVDFIPERFVAESVAEGLSQFDLDGKRILIPRALEAREVLPQKLEDRGAQVDVVPVYRTILDDSSAELIKGKLQAGEVDIVTFTSSSTVKNFVKLVGEEIVRDRMPQVCIACIGPITAETAESFGMKVNVLAEEFTVEGLTEAMIKRFSA